MDHWSKNRICEHPECNNPGHNHGPGKREKLCTMHKGIKSNLYGWDYKKFRKDYCENIDGRLGLVCTATIVEPMWQLDADHIDGDPTNNTENNIQTLCKNCHAVKTKDSKDYLTAGRKTLKIMEAA